MIWKFETTPGALSRALADAQAEMRGHRMGTITVTPITFRSFPQGFTVVETILVVIPCACCIEAGREEVEDVEVGDVQVMAILDSVTCGSCKRWHGQVVDHKMMGTVAMACSNPNGCRCTGRPVDV